MPGWRRAAAPLLAAALVGTPNAAAALEPEPRVVLTFDDPRIDESSGLVDLGGRMVTVNDSGDGPVLYVVDKADGRTVSTLTFAEDEVSDVEALAPGSDGGVWVADIGDNSRLRPFVEVHRVRVRPGAGDVRVPAQRFRLAYPDGPNDAETLLADPRTGRLYVVSKWVTGGTVYAAPRRLRAGMVNRLRPVGRVPGLVTDGAFLGDGRHVVLRTYGTAAVYAFPGFTQVARFPLPAQEQGEGLAVGRDGSVYLSTEGTHTDVLRVRLPRAATGPSPAAAAAPSGVPTSEGTEAATPAEDPVGVSGGVAVLSVLALGLASLVAVRASRRRSPRTR